MRAKGDSRIKENPTLDYASDSFAIVPPPVARLCWCEWRAEIELDVVPGEAIGGLRE